MKEGSQKFYVQDTRQYVGTCMLWWEEGSCGYTYNLSEAKVFTQDEIDKMYSIKEGTKRAWPQEYIDKRVEVHVDMQSCSYEDVKGES